MILCVKIKDKRFYVMNSTVLKNASNKLTFAEYVELLNRFLSVVNPMNATSRCVISISTYVELYTKCVQYLRRFNVYLHNGC